MSLSEKKKSLKPEQKDQLINQFFKVSCQLEQNKVLGVTHGEKHYNQVLEQINKKLENHNINIENELKPIPYGGIEMDGGDLKDKSTEELLRIQTIQIHELTKNINGSIKNSNHRLDTITNIMKFWLILTILSLLAGLISLLA